MTIAETTCPDVSKAEITSLRSDGIEPTLDDIAQLIALGREVEARDGFCASVFDVPVMCRDAELYPITLQAERWLAKVRPIMGDSAYLHSIGYACAVGRNPCAFRSVSTAKNAIDAVEAWANEYPVGREELADAIAHCLEADDPIQVLEEIEDEKQAPELRKPHNPTVLDRLLEDIACEYGWDARDLTCHAMPEIMRMADALQRRRTALAGAGGAEAQDSAQATAFRRLLCAAELIRRREADGN